MGHSLRHAALSASCVLALAALTAFMLIDIDAPPGPARAAQSGIIELGTR
ncbi:hypothetical protein ACWDG1_46385 [Streptomyces sp. NPDC001177]